MVLLCLFKWWRKKQWIEKCLDNNVGQSVSEISNNKNNSRPFSDKKIQQTIESLSSSKDEKVHEEMVKIFNNLIEYKDKNILNE